MQQNIRAHIKEILKGVVGSEVAFSVERVPASAKGFGEARGDYASNIALVRAKYEGRQPMEIANRVATILKERYPHMFYAVVPAAPGFLNMTLDPAYLLEILRDSFVAHKKPKLGRASVEFISANPTGPMHIGNARGGPIGDVIANLLEEKGYEVTREYYHNDAGAQIAR